VKIQNIHTNNLRNDAHFQFHTEAKDLFTRQEAAALFNMVAMVSHHAALYAREDEALKKIVKSAFTQEIHDADKARDETFAAMFEINKGMCKHFNPALRHAAIRLQVVLDTYGNISRKPLNEQTSAIYNLVQELKSDKYVSDTNSVGLMTWLVELEKRNADMEALMIDRFDETAAKSNIVMKEARREVDEAYRAIVERINAVIVIEGVARYENFVRTLNAIIAKYSIKHHHHSSTSGSSTGGTSSGGTSSGDVGDGSHGDGSHGGIQYEPPLYDPNKHYTEYQLGDAVRLPNGDIYQVKDLGYVHYAPDSPNGHWGWEKV
jgi:hypothetical protein